MTWSTTDIVANDIMQQDGIFAYNFIAGAAIKKGKAVYVSAVNTVSPTTSTASQCDAIGVACYNAAANAQVAIAGPGNIVVCCMDAYEGSLGVPLYGDTDGTFDATAGNAVRTSAILIDDTPADVSGSVAATYHVIKALLV